MNTDSSTNLLKKYLTQQETNTMYTTLYRYFKGKVNEKAERQACLKEKLDKLSTDTLTNVYRAYFYDYKLFQYSNPLS